MKKNLFNLKTAVIALGMVFSTALNAATFTAIASGNWSAGSTWSGGTAPGTNLSGDNIVIGSGFNVILDGDVTFANGFLVSNSLQVDGTLSNSVNHSMTMASGVLTGSGNINIHRVRFTNTATVLFSGTMNVGIFENSTSALSLAFVATANIADSLILESGALSLDNSSSFVLGANSTVRRNAGTLGINGGLFNTTALHNVMYNGSSKTAGAELSGSSVQNVMVNMGGSSQNLSLNSDLTIGGNLMLNSGSMDMNGKKLTLMGDVMSSSTSSIMSNSTSELIINGTGNMTGGLMFASGSSLNSMTVNRSGSTVKLMSGLNIVGHLHLMNGTYSMENGSTLTMGAGSTIHMEGGSLSNNSGNFAGSAAYNVEYTGGTNATSGVELTGSGMHDLMINYANNTSKMTLNTSVAVGGELKLMSGWIDLSGKNLTLNGSMSQGNMGSAGFIGNSASELNLNLTSTSTSTLMFDQSNRNLSKLMLNLTGSQTSSLMLGSNLSIANELNLTKGRLALGQNSDLMIMSTGTITGYDNTKYIVTNSMAGSTTNGRLQMNVGANSSSWITFPVGTNENYSPAHIQNSTAGNFMVRAANEMLASGTTGTDMSSSMSVVRRTWHVDAETGVAVNMNLKLGWMTESEVNGFNRSNAMLRHYTNGAWDMSTAVTATAGANSTYEVSRNNITSLSPFGVTDNSAAVGIKQNVALSTSFDLYPNPAKDAITVKAPVAAAYSYELIDITGRTLATMSGSESVKFDVNKLEKGYYFIKITNLETNTTGTKRFVKD